MVSSGVWSAILNDVVWSAKQYEKSLIVKIIFEKNKIMSNFTVSIVSVGGLALLCFMASTPNVMTLYRLPYIHMDAVTISDTHYGIMMLYGVTDSGHQWFW